MKNTLKQLKKIDMPIIHECYKYGHIWKIIEDAFSILENRTKKEA